MSECKAWDDIVERAIDACNKGVPSDNSIGIAWAKCEIDQLKAQVARLEEVSRESMNGMTANAMTERAFMAEITSLKDVLNESHAQSLALHDADVIEKFGEQLRQGITMGDGIGFNNMTEEVFYRCYKDYAKTLRRNAKENK